MEKSSFFNSVTHDRKYKAEDWAEYFSTFISNGVFPAPKVGLGVTAGGNMKVLLDKGQAFLNGYRYQNTEPLELELPIPDGALARICRVVIRWNLTARNIQAAVKSSPLALTPAAPALQRDAEAFELCVAEILIPAGSTAVQAANITDTRFDDALCGIVGWMVEDVDTSELFEQFRAAFRDQRTAQGTEFYKWFDELTDVLDENAAGHIMNLLNEYRMKTFVVEVSADEWETVEDADSTYWIKKAIVPGLDPGMIPNADIILSDDATTANKELDAWAYVSKIEIGDGEITITCLRGVPKAQMNIRLKEAK